MRKLRFFGGALAVLVICGGMGGGSPIPPVDLRSGSLPPFHSYSETNTFAAKDRACVIVIGSTGRSYMALYVFDGDGNCVAHDDVSNAAIRDDVAVEWFPPQTAPYAFELRNLGPYTNGFEIVLR